MGHVIAAQQGICYKQAGKRMQIEDCFLIVLNQVQNQVNFMISMKLIK
jgi:hypothetical protein